MITRYRRVNQRKIEQMKREAALLKSFEWSPSMYRPPKLPLGSAALKEMGLWLLDSAGDRRDAWRRSVGLLPPEGVR